MENLKTSRQGGLALFMNKMLEQPTLDPYLYELATEAAEPIVRSIALRTLIFQRSKVFVGYQKRWVDKSSGIKKREAMYLERSAPNPIELIQIGVCDHSAFVRRTAADGLIKHIKSADVTLDTIADKLSQDKSAAVRSRVAYLRKVRAE